MPRLRAVRYTLVRHSAATTDLRFARSVQSSAVLTEAEARRIGEAGGVLFDDYREAEDFGHAAMYPPEVEGLVGRVEGSFSKITHDGAPIYIPVQKPVAA